jgi:hypothetical protein
MFFAVTVVECCERGFQTPYNTKVTYTCAIARKFENLTAGDTNRTVPLYDKQVSPGGQDFGDFNQFTEKHWRFSLKSNVFIKVFFKIAVFRVKPARFFGGNILK